MTDNFQGDEGTGPDISEEIRKIPSAPQTEAGRDALHVVDMIGEAHNIDIGYAEWRKRILVIEAEARAASQGCPCDEYEACAEHQSPGAASQERPPIELWCANHERMEPLLAQERPQPDDCGNDADCIMGPDGHCHHNRHGHKHASQERPPERCPSHTQCQHRKGHEGAHDYDGMAGYFPAQERPQPEATHNDGDECTGIQCANPQHGWVAQLREGEE